MVDRCVSKFFTSFIRPPVLIKTPFYNVADVRSICKLKLFRIHARLERVLERSLYAQIIFKSQ